MTYSKDSPLGFSLSSAKMTPPPPPLLSSTFPGDQYFSTSVLFQSSSAPVTCIVAALSCGFCFMKDWRTNKNISCQSNARFLYHVILYIHKNIIPSGALCMLVSPSKFTGRPKWEAIVRVRQNSATLARFDRNSSLRWPQSMWVLVIAFFSWGDLTDFYDFRCP